MTASFSDLNALLNPAATPSPSATSMEESEAQQDEHTGQDVSDAHTLPNPWSQPKKIKDASFQIDTKM